MARPASPPTSTYRDKYQEEMAKKLQSDSYFGIIDSIKSAELQRAPNLNASRITTRLTPRWEKIACFLLLQLDIRVLHAILVSRERGRSDGRPIEERRPRWRRGRTILLHLGARETKPNC